MNFEMDYVIKTDNSFIVISMEVVLQQGMCINNYLEAGIILTRKDLISNISYTHGKATL